MFSGCTPRSSSLLRSDGSIEETVVVALELIESSPRGSVNSGSSNDTFSSSLAGSGSGSSTMTIDSSVVQINNKINTWESDSHMISVSPVQVALEPIYPPLPSTFKAS